MKKKTIIILASIVIVIIICCCLILAGLMIRNYSTTKNVMFNGEPVGEMIVTATPYIIIKITGEAEETDQQEPIGDYAHDAGIKLVNCSAEIGKFSDIAVRLNENVNLFFDSDYIDEVNASVDNIEQYCTDIGQEEGVPPAYVDVNEELQMADEDMKNFVENIHKGLEEFNIDAISQALYDLSSASSHYENTGEYLTD